MSGSSEEKSHPASEKKIRKEREKGKVAKAPDFFSAITTCTLIFYVFQFSSSIMSSLEKLFDASSASINLDFPQAIDTMLNSVEKTLITCAFIPLAVSVIAAIVAGLIINRGFIFSLEPMKPDLNKLNPATGLMGLYKKDKWIDLIKTLLKVVLFGTTLAFLIYSTMGTLTGVPACAPGCVPGMVETLIKPLLSVAIVFYLIAGGIDLLLQKWLFLQQMRMTKTEVKNENKDSNGNPQVKQQQNQIRKTSALIGQKQATLFIYSSGHKTVALGLRYMPADTPVPRIVCKAWGDNARKMIQTAERDGKPIVFDPEIATELSEKIELGQFITVTFFSRVAKILKSV